MPDLVAPAVGWLAHESCSVTGEILIAIAGRVARVAVVETPGVYQPSWTIEDVGARIEAIRDIATRWSSRWSPTGTVTTSATASGWQGGYMITATRWP